MDGAKEDQGLPPVEVVKTGKLAKTYTAEARPPGVKPPWRKQKGPAGQNNKKAGGTKERNQNPKAQLKQLKAAFEEGLIEEGTYRVVQRALAAELAGMSFTTSCTVTHTDGSCITTTSTSARSQSSRGGGGGGAAKEGWGPQLSAPPHNMAAVIKRLASGRKDVRSSSFCARLFLPCMDPLHRMVAGLQVRVHDGSVVDYCVARLIETNDGGEECLDKETAPGVDIVEVKLEDIGAHSTAQHSCCRMTEALVVHPPVTSAYSTHGLATLQQASRQPTAQAWRAGSKTPTQTARTASRRERANQP
jgi:hypothetical protein